MLMLKILIYSAILLTSSAIGIVKSQKYIYRVEELKEFKSALNMYKTKIKFTYEPIPEIFEEISKNILPVIGKVFKNTCCNMKTMVAGEAWNKAIDREQLNIEDEDKNILKGLSKLMGETDIEGQISQIEITSTFLDEQIKKAEKDKERNQGMYRKLGVVIGLGIVIILI